MLDFFLFHTLISRHVLMVFYFLGALVMPLAAWLTALAILHRFPRAREFYDLGMHFFTRLMPLRWRLAGLLLFVMSFLFMELMWRMLFEYLIAFMQMRDALMHGLPGPQWSCHPPG